MKTLNSKIIAWSLYDFANSAFITVVVTFIYSTFFTKVIVGDSVLGTTLWSRAITIAGLLTAILSPIIGAFIDRYGHRKRFLFVCTAVSVLMTAALFFPQAGDIVTAISIFVIADLGFELGLVLYNAYLPELAPDGKLGQVSGFGWAVGYLGGLLALLFCWLLFVKPDPPLFGIAAETHGNIRVTNLFIAAWFALFSIPFFTVIKDKQSANHGEKISYRLVFSQIIPTLKEILKFKEILKLLIARLFYNDGLTTIFAFGGIYAAGTFGFTFDEIFIFGIVLNVAAGSGAYLLSFADDKLGGKTLLLISIAGLFCGVLATVLTESRVVFWISGVLIGIFSGPNQSASRSFMARLIPAKRETEFFGFYAFSGKATSFMGPLLLGIFTAYFHSQRAGIAVILVFFVIGGIILSFVKESGKSTCD